MAVALFQLMTANELRMFYVFAVIFGLGYGGVAALMSPVLAELFGLREHGIILGVAVFAFAAGGTIGPVMMGRIFDISSSYQTAFIVLATIAVTGVILTSLVRPTGKKGLV